MQAGRIVTTIAIMALDPEIYPYGYAAETPNSEPCYIHETGFGWEVHRQYMFYDGRPSVELVAVYATRAEAEAYQVRLLAVLNTKSLPDGSPP